MLERQFLMSNSSLCAIIAYWHGLDSQLYFSLMELLLSNEVSTHGKKQEPIFLNAEEHLAAVNLY